MFYNKTCAIYNTKCDLDLSTMRMRDLRCGQCTGLLQGIARLAVHGALVLEYEDMLMGKSSKLSWSQCLCLGRIEIP